MWKGCFKTAHITPKSKDIFVGFLHCLDCLRFSGTLGLTTILAKHIMRIVHSGVFRKRWQLLIYLTNQLLYSFCSSYSELDVLRASNIDNFCECCGTSWWPTAEISRVHIPKMRSPTAGQRLSCIRFRTKLQWMDGRCGQKRTKYLWPAKIVWRLLQHLVFLTYLSPATL